MLNLMTLEAADDALTRMRRIRAVAPIATRTNVMHTTCRALLVRCLFLYEYGDDDAAIATAKESLACGRAEIEFARGGDRLDGIKAIETFFICAFALLVNGDRAGAISMLKDQVCVPTLRALGKLRNATCAFAATLRFVKRLPQHYRPCAGWVPYAMTCIAADVEDVDSIIYGV